MNTITKLFDNKQNILSIYFTAGYPSLNDTNTIIKILDQSPVDLIEIGMPYSDPLADGPTIQQTSQQALKNGINLDLIFKQIESLNNEIKTPLILMGYLNQILSYGVEAFFEKCKSCNIQALIIPDLPIAEYKKSFQQYFKENEIANIFLITPQTSDERIKKIDSISSSFIYLVASSSTTGSKQDINQEQEAYFKRIESMKLQNPTLIGFGISNHQSFKTACKYSNGVIIGSAFLNAVSDSKHLEKDINAFIKSMLNN